MKRNKGFTLVELMVVIVIIGILVAIAMPNFVAAQKRAKISTLKANAKVLQSAVETYNIDYGNYPDRISSIKSSAGYKVFKNPFTYYSDSATSSGRGAWRTTAYGGEDSPGDLTNNFSDSWATKGLVLYNGLNAEGESTTTLSSTDGNLNANPPTTFNYLIMICDENGKPIPGFVLSAGTLTTLSKALSNSH